jgi:hypothetical protein
MVGAAPLPLAEPLVLGDGLGAKENFPDRKDVILVVGTSPEADRVAALMRGEGRLAVSAERKPSWSEKDPDPYVMEVLFRTHLALVAVIIPEKESDASGILEVVKYVQENCHAETPFAFLVNDAGAFKTGRAVSAVLGRALLKKPDELKAKLEQLLEKGNDTWLKNPERPKPEPFRFPSRVASTPALEKRKTASQAMARH